jgi:hypothetical protein
MDRNHYEIVVRGHIGDTLIGSLYGLTARATPAHTVLHGQVADQAALFAVLDHLDGLGLELLVVRRAVSGA